MTTNAITLTISIMIVALFIQSMKNRGRSFKNEIVSLGILGTFVGIAIGLYHFDVTNIKDSMPQLLEGLKTAFVTSGMGIFFSILLSIFKPQATKKEEVIYALEEVVKDFNKNLTEQFGDNFKHLNEAVKNMILWQDNYKSHIQESEQSISHIIKELKQISLAKESEQANIQKLIDNLTSSSDKVKISLEETTDIVKENMQLLLREANGRL
ncbi:MAG: MotA/TolQ/ExbB proton channel family protein [Campylobacterales bacterium]|nr:MotA/TolQ/ExbB proton channel family protein [Campylobacterota bacterium]MBD3797670.1 MotA/TolQ/ExbB proton channel family protein [Campylobacterales bacterium]